LGGEEPNDEGRELGKPAEGECMPLLLLLLLLRKGKDEDSVETGGTGNEGEKEEASPSEEERGSGRELVRLRLGEPARGLCLMFLRTLR